MCEYNKYFREVFVESDYSLSEIDLDYPFYSLNNGNEERNYIDNDNSIGNIISIFVNIDLLIDKLEKLKSKGSEYVYVSSRGGYGYELRGIKLIEDNSLKEKIKLIRKYRKTVEDTKNEYKKKIKNLEKYYKEKIDNM